MHLEGFRSVPPTFRVVDLGAVVEPFREAVINGLWSRPRAISPKYFYDAEGARLFETICTLPEYYPTRTECTIVEHNLPAIIRAIGPRAHLLEYGSGGTRKVRLILDALIDPVAYTPIDISAEQLRETGLSLARERPDLDVIGLAADFTRPFAVPRPSQMPKRRVAMFLGSSLGNFHPDEAERFLRQVGNTVGAGGGLLLGVDLEKDPTVLEAAYNDAQGVTAAFNLNLLTRMRRELGAKIAPNAFEHRAIYNTTLHRIEMHLVAREETAIEVGSHGFLFSRGDSILTECSYKYTLGSIAKLTGAAGWSLERVWTDASKMFALLYLSLTTRR